VCERCNYEHALDMIEEMIDNPKYDFAETTLTGIYEWIDKNQHVTPRQMESLENIYASKEN
jgi:hypothetical protein